MNREILLHTIRLLLLLILVIILGMNFAETFKSSKDKESKFHLYPIKGNTKYCQENGNYPAFMPTECRLKKGSKYKLYHNRNCRCVDKLGICVECYPEIKLRKNKKSSR